jgi:hypothetical protein
VTVLLAVHFQNEIVHPGARGGVVGRGVPRQAEARRGEFVVTRSRINGFFGSDLDVVLAALRARRLVVAGDACASADAELQAASLRTLALHVERVASVDELLAELARDG